MLKSRDGAPNSPHAPCMEHYEWVEEGERSAEETDDSQEVIEETNASSSGGPTARPTPSIPTAGVPPGTTRAVSAPGRILFTWCDTGLSS